MLVLHYALVVLGAGTYLRTYLAIQTNPGLVPLSPMGKAARAAEQAFTRGQKKDKKQRARGGDGDVEAASSTNGSASSGNIIHTIPGPDTDPDSPGLECFYSKNVFICTPSGRPKWCGKCLTWKPDRAHHSSELNRCIRKMDHYCVWIGGIVSETCEWYSLLPCSGDVESTAC